MKYPVLFPSSYFDIKKVDEEYESELEYLNKIHAPYAFFNYDGFTSGEKLKLYSNNLQKGTYIYRGWMMQSEVYENFYKELAKYGIQLINSPLQYRTCHEFPYSYPVIKNFTPEILTFPTGKAVDWNLVKTTFDKFIIKDYVKSIKGYDFPLYFDSGYANAELDTYLSKFIDLRGDMFSSGIVVKNFVNLKKYGEQTNEYRIFYLNGKPLFIFSHCRNIDAISPSDEYIQSIPILKSNFYTIDIAEIEDGSWTIIESGDGQVSGLPRYEDADVFYEHLP